MIAWLHTLKAYERHVSAAAMAGGFAFDNVSYGRVDHPVTQTLLIVYLLVAAGSIILLHYFEAHQEWQHKAIVKARAYLPALTQFMFGSLWSAFLVFYARSGVLSATWPYFLILGAIFLGNEVFKQYHARFIFTSTLFFFALLSYAIFMVPVFTHTIGQVTFLLSGAAAAFVFVLFLGVIGQLSTTALGTIRRQTALGAFVVLAAITGLYFLNVLPPLPLALQKGGIYHSICRVPARGAGQVRCYGREVPKASLARVKDVYYEAMEEPQSWLTWIGIPPVIHIEPGAPVIAFSAVFAPISLSTSTVHIWQRYDSRHGEWRTMQRVIYSITGGRDKGYRGYSVKNGAKPGLWRVDFETVDGRLIGRTVFQVEYGRSASPDVAVRL